MIKFLIIVKVSCPIYNENELVGFEDFDLFYSANYLDAHSKRNQNITTSLDDRDENNYVISTNRIDSTLATIIDRCFEFLNETITELQFGGVVEFLMEEIRKKTDEKLATYDKRITEETQSLYLNLTSTNPADWSKVGPLKQKNIEISCRYFV